MKLLPGIVQINEPLDVPKWNTFWQRYLILLIMGLIVIGITLYRPLYLFWLEWDQNTGTVTSFGITVHPTGIKTNLQKSVNDIHKITSGVLYSLYILLVIIVYGPRRFWRSATQTDMKRVSCYVFGIGAVLILGGYIFEWLGAYSGDPASMRDTSLVMIVIVGIIGPVMEELFARFTLHQMLRAKTNFLVAAIVSSLIFGLLHFGYPDPIKMLMAGLTGTFLCWTYEKTGSIITPIGIHIFNNMWMQLV